MQLRVSKRDSAVRPWLLLSRISLFKNCVYFYKGFIKIAVLWITRLIFVSQHSASLSRSMLFQEKLTDMQYHISVRPEVILDPKKIKLMLSSLC